jgi:hypothetical protein
MKQVKKAGTGTGKNNGSKAPGNTVLKSESAALVIKEGTTSKGLERKLTNEAKRKANSDRKEAEKKLSHHYNNLQKFGVLFVAQLSKETGKKITVENIQALKYSDFLPYLTEREEISNQSNGWTFSRLLNCVVRFYRNERKNKDMYSPFTDAAMSDLFNFA